MTAERDYGGEIRHSMVFLPERLAARIAADVAKSYRSPPVPAWCRSPLLRGFVMGNALAAPLLLLLWAWTS